MTRRRLNRCLTYLESTHRKLRTLAKADNLSMGQFVERLILRAWKKKGGARGPKR